MTTLLFAYGTLTPSDSEAAARHGWVPDRVRGRLFDLGLYPTLVDLDDLNAGSVQGYVRSVNHDDLARLDVYEGVAEGLYCRRTTITEAGRSVLLYVCARPLPPEARGPIECWDGPRVEFAFS